MARSICSAATSASPWQCGAGSFALGGIGAMASQCGDPASCSTEGLLRFVRGNELRQVLLTLGVAFVLNDLALVIWGGDSFTRADPAGAARRPAVCSAYTIRRIVCSCWRPASWCSQRFGCC